MLCSVPVFLAAHILLLPLLELTIFVSLNVLLTGMALPSTRLTPPVGWRRVLFSWKRLLCSSWSAMVPQSPWCSHQWLHWDEDVYCRRLWWRECCDPFLWNLHGVNGLARLLLDIALCMVYLMCSAAFCVYGISLTVLYLHTYYISLDGDSCICLDLCSLFQYTAIFIIKKESRLNCVSGLHVHTLTNLLLGKP